MDRFGFMVPELAYPSGGLPKPQLKADLADQDERDEPQINALIDEVDDGINSDQRENIEDKTADKEKDVLVAGGPLFGFGECHTREYSMFLVQLSRQPNDYPLLRRVAENGRGPRSGVRVQGDQDYALVPVRLARTPFCYRLVLGTAPSVENLTEK